MFSKRHKLIAFIALAVFLFPWAEASAEWKKPTRTNQKMGYFIEGGDTVYYYQLPAARIYQQKPRKKGRQWRQYYRLVYNFAKTYPYALIAKDIVWEVDSTITKDGLKYIQKDRYVGAVVKDLFSAYEKPLRNLTVTQGQILMKLIDRECGILSYDIIKQFKNKYAAGFWQGIAKMFGNDLKKHYDPKGSDAALEELVIQWQNGTFERTYFEVFGQFPPNQNIPEDWKRDREKKKKDGKK